MSKKMKEVLIAGLPEGSIWNLAVDEDFDKLMAGWGDSVDDLYDYLAKLSELRDPQKTQLLNTLLREYGMTGLAGPGITEAELRQYIQALKYAPAGTGSESYMEQRLHDFGFTDLHVYQNYPTVDPRPYVETVFAMTAGDDDAYADDADAYAGYTQGAGELLVNGDIFTYDKAYEAQANGQSTFAGNGKAVSGYFLRMERNQIEYTIPSDPNYWRFIFFIGGPKMAGCTNPIEDADMEAASTAAWTAGDCTVLSKDVTIKETGIRSLRITADDCNPDGELSPLKIDPSQIMHYRMHNYGNDFIKDIQNGIYPAAIFGSPTSTEQKEGRSLNFGGSDYLNCYNLGALLTNDFTFSVVIKTSGTPTYNQTIIGRTDDPSIQWIFGVDQATGYLYYKDAAGSSTTASSLGVVDDNEWYHVGFTISSGGSCKIFKDGVFTSSFSITEGTETPSTYIGTHDPLSDDWFDGHIMEPKMFTEEKSQSWITDQYDEFAENKILDYRTYSPTTQLRDEIINGEFDHPSPEEIFWKTLNASGTFEYVSDTDNYIRCNGIVGGQWGAKQDVLYQFGDTNQYRCTGKARGNGSRYPRLQLGSITAWDGTTSTSWQTFDVIAVSDDPIVKIVAVGAAGGYADWANVTCSPISNISSPDPDISDVIDIEGNYIGNNNNCIDVATPYGPGLLFNGIDSGYGTVIIDSLAASSFSDGFTLTAWISGSDAFQTANIIARKIDGTNGGSQVHFAFGVDDGYLSFEDETFGVSKGSTRVAGGSWHFVACVLKGGGLNKFFIDGVQDGPNFTKAITTYPLLNTFIGAHGSFTFDGVFSGTIVSPMIFGNAKDATWMSDTYDAAQSMTEYAYALQDLATPILVGTEFEGYAWGDGNGAIPVLKGYTASVPEWNILWTGTDSVSKQFFSFTTTKQIDKIEMSANYTENGFVNFDDLDVCGEAAEEISYIQIPIELRSVLHRVVLKFKPIRSWAVLLIEYI